MEVTITKEQIDYWVDRIEGAISNYEGSAYKLAQLPEANRQPTIGEELLEIISSWESKGRKIQNKIEKINDAIKVLKTIEHNLKLLSEEKINELKFNTEILTSSYG